MALSPKFAGQAFSANVSPKAIHSKAPFEVISSCSRLHSEPQHILYERIDHYTTNMLPENVVFLKLLSPNGISDDEM